MRLNYRAPRESLQGKIRSMTSLNIAISKDVTPDLTLTFSVQDAFNRRRRNSVIDTDNLYQESVFQWRPRSFVGTINYRINAKKERPKKRGYEGDGDMEM